MTDAPSPPTGACDCGDDQSVIDMLVVYSTLAKNAAGGTAALQARVNNAIASANAAFIASHVVTGGPTDRLEVRLAGFVEVAYDEQAPAWLDHLDRVTNPTDGVLDNVPPMRDAYHADVVSLIVDDTRFTGGAAFYAVYSDASAYSVLNWRAEGSGSLTFAHELGHNFGCAHDRGNSSFSPFVYAWGYSFAANGTTYGTIMSYTGANLVPNYSNPTLLHSSGVPMGSPLSSALPTYNALAVATTRWTLASYRTSGRAIDCNGNGIADSLDIAQGRSQDSNGNCRPDECEYRLYVDASNTGPVDGLSWNTAYKDLAEALAFASMKCSNVSSIWVAGAAGGGAVYRPDQGTGDRYARFALRSGLAIYGGFQGRSRFGGGETSVAQRVLSGSGTGGVGAYPSVLSGDIGAAGVDTDNSYNVLLAQSTDSTAILDGFVIERGYQDSDGAGMYIDNAGPTIRNCTFRNNRAGGGGGLVAAGVFSHPAVASCVFTDNVSTGSGGAAGVRDGATVTFQSCTFSGGNAQYGGAAYLYNGGSATFAACTFSGNTAQVNSGAIDCYLNCTANVQACRFLGNHAVTGGGGAMIVHTGCAATIEGSTFDSNVAGGTGGAVWVQTSGCTVSDSTFTSNVCGDGGGAISCYGGGTLSIRGCTMRNGRARWGGAVECSDSTLNVSATRLESNTATQYSGGAIDLYNAGVSLTNSVLRANTSADGGAGVSLGQSSTLTVSNCTIYGNAAANSGGGIGMYAATLGVANSILYGNTTTSGQSVMDQQLTVFTGSRTVNRSCVQGLTGALGGVGNIGGNPLLVSPATGDVVLGSGSPCVDAGDNTLVPAGVLTDLAGSPRFADDPSAPNSGLGGGAGGAAIVDMGALERQVAGGAGCSLADVTGIGGPPSTPDGLLTGDDFNAFIGAFAAGDLLADVTGIGGPPATPDGLITGDDFNAFIAAFATGCP